MQKKNQITVKYFYSQSETFAVESTTTEMQHKYKHSLKNFYSLP